MNTNTTSRSASGIAATTRVVLNDVHKVSTVALDLVRAAAEYQFCVNRNEDTAGFIAEFSVRFGIAYDVSEALLAGRLLPEIDGDQLVVQAKLTEADLDHAAASHGTRFHALVAPSAFDPQECARRMHSVMTMHVASRGVPIHRVSSLPNLVEFLYDLRHWCDECRVDFYKAMDQALLRYMDFRHHRRNSGGR